MKLAEALQERSDLNRRIAELRSRLTDNALVQEGEKPAEDPAELTAELDRCVAALEEIIARINLANCRTTAEGKTLTELLARRARGTEIKVISTVNVAQLQKRVDAMSRELRQLDNTIQQANWTTDL